MQASVKRMSATYFWPCQSHGSLGPSCAVADVHGDGATIWTSSQGTHHLRVNLSSIFGLDVNKVRVIYLDGAGSYGGNGNDDAAADAVLLSKTIGQPVRVQWMRHDEHGWDPKGPQQLIDLRAGVDKYGRIVAWETEMWVPAVLGPTGTIPLLAPAEAGLAQAAGQWPGMIAQNGDPPYLMRHVNAVAHRLKQTPLRPSHMRAPGKIANAFAVECFTDELAAAAGTDPMTYREEAISDFRAIDVLRRAAAMIGWKKRWSPNPDAKQDGLLIGRGIAYARYKQVENYIATAMEVVVDPATGKIGVRRVTCAHDCGLVINPDALQNQIEGSIIQTISRTLYEEVKFDRSRVTSVDWASYPILRFPETPIITVALIDRPEMPLLGAGEASNTTVAAALGNAFFDATGIRMRSVPFTAERVKAALAASVKA
jgi:CO/xanthine dehydrogenase Mo-binding subunit